MRILYVLNDTLNNSGTESAILNYYDHIDRSKYVIDFLLHTTVEEAECNKKCEELRKQGAVVHVVTPRRISVSQNRKDMIRIFREQRYDVVHAHGDAANALILRYAKECKVKVRIAHCHNTRIPIKVTGVKSLLHYMYLEWCRLYVRHVATGYMACSEEAARWLFGKRMVDTGRVYILNNAIDTEHFRFNPAKRKIKRNELKIADDCLVIGHTGRFSDQKNQVFLFELLSHIKKKYHGIKLLLVGDGPDRNKLVKKTAELGIEDLVIFYGETDDVSDVLQAMDVFAFPSLYEGLGISVIEAQANGLPCLVTDSKDVSKASGITPLVRFIPLSETKKWEKEILSFVKTKVARHDHTDEIRKAGYDITTEAVNLEKYYDDCI